MIASRSSPSGAALDAIPKMSPVEMWSSPWAAAKRLAWYLYRARRPSMMTLMRRSRRGIINIVDEYRDTPSNLKAKAQFVRKAIAVSRWV
jgi:hypothetical protein